jgi:hypothetical protein
MVAELFVTGCIITAAQNTSSKAGIAIFLIQYAACRRQYHSNTFLNSGFATQIILLLHQTQQRAVTFSNNAIYSPFYFIFILNKNYLVWPEK